MPITALPTPPNRNSPTTFADDGDDFLGALPTFVTEANALEANVNAKEASATASALAAAGSATAAGAIAWVAATSYVVGNARYSPIDGQTYRCISETSDSTDPSANPTKWARVNLTPTTVYRFARTSNTILGTADRGYLIDITSGTFSQTFTAAATLTAGWFCWIRNSGSGDITLDPNASETINGATTLTLSANKTALVQCDGTGFYAVVADGIVGDHGVWVHTGNGHGSTNTFIRRFTTTVSSTGTAITYADSATLGASFTINTPGVYAITYSDYYTGALQNFGVSLNSTQLSAIAGITAAHRIGMTTSIGAGLSNVLTIVALLAAGDVIRPHDAGSNNAASAAHSYFQIRKIAS
jgi:hypothetical protein